MRHREGGISDHGGTANRGRLRDLVTYAVLRPLLFVYWSLVLWGTWALVAFLWALAAHGPGEALARLGPGEGGPWAWGNAILAGVAAGTWVTAVWTWRSRQARRR